MLVDVHLKAFLVASQGEEVILLLEPDRFDGRVVRTVAVDQLALLKELLRRHAVPALVAAFVDVAPGLDLCEQRLDPPNVVRVLGPYEPVVRDAEAGLDLPVDLGHPVGVGAGVLPLLSCLAFHVLGMFVGPGQKEGVVTDQAVIAGEHVGPHQLVDIAEVRGGIHVDDRGGDVKLSHSEISSRCRQPRPSTRHGVEPSRNAPGGSPASHAEILRGLW